MEYKHLLETFGSKFTSAPRIFRSPGRINIIGEHTDYNDGFVLPAAIDKEIGIIMAVNNSDQFNIYSYDTEEEVSFSIDTYISINESWAKYIIGVIDQLVKAGHKVSGIDCVFGGDIPIGAGMSSSAALECATLYGFNELFNLNLNKRAIALMAQKAENEYVGVNCGIMDQFASVFSQENHAIKLDCRDLSYEMVEIYLTEYQFVMVDSMVKHSLASSEYNVRRAECEEGVSVLNQVFPSVKSLRDVSTEQLAQVQSQMPPKVFQRCKYVVDEISRVNEATKALETGNVKMLGDLLYASHEGLQNEFEVSCTELDFLVDFTRNHNWVLGARMMGGGFGGCSINLVETSKVNSFITAIQEAYVNEYNKTPTVYLVNTAPGTSEIER